MPNNWFAKNDEQILQNPVQAILVVFTVKRFACRLVSYRNTKYVLIRLNFKCICRSFFFKSSFCAVSINYSKVFA